ncbi:MAG: hypothetical protein NW237_01880 [Cyanobacteriota bacterium]|nr:hypothetical protein [Cyanobacteriota bacterium]
MGMGWGSQARRLSPLPPMDKSSHEHTIPAVFSSRIAIKHHEAIPMPT